MSDKHKHIPFHEWEVGQPLDEEHLSSCDRCRREWELVRFLRFQAESAPRIDAPPFFASRVARLAMEQTGAAIWNLVERWSRRLIPVFAALLMATSFLLYRTSQEPGADDYARILAEPEELSELSLDEVVVFLHEPEGETP